ncbi:MAG: TetR/AcrR family transcriptional regulator [Pseudomonadota bacterium]
MAERKVRRRRKEARPGEIIEAGFEVFTEKGFNGTRLDEVAARAGVAKGTLYLYFDSKEALFEAALKAQLGSTVNEIGAMLEAYDGPSDKLVELLLSGMYQRMSDPRARTLLRIVIGEGERFPNLVAFYHREVVSKARGFMQRIVERGIERGEFSRTAVADLPMVIAGPGIMATVWQLVFAQVEPVDLEEFRRAHIALVLDGLRARPGPPAGD